MTVPGKNVAPSRINRRLDQRNDCLTGLYRWLEASRRRLGIGALAVANNDGCLVAGAGAAQICEELAAIAPLAEKPGDSSFSVRSPLAASGAWLCAAETPIEPREWALVAEGCERILGLLQAA